MDSENTNTHQHVAIDIEAMRAKLYVAMANALLPFMKQLEELAVVEAILKREMLPGANVAKIPGIPRTNGVDYKPPRSWSQEKKNTPESGPYSRTAQPQALLDIINANPGLSTREITAKMVEGGYPFDSKSPIQPVTTALRHLSIKGRVVTYREPHDRKRFYPLSWGKKKTEQAKRTPGVYKALKDAAEKIVKEGPEAGLTRKEVLDHLIAKKFHFSKANPANRQITWALNDIHEEERIGKNGQGATALFFPK
jgi:hypothetical protein